MKKNGNTSAAAGRLDRGAASLSSIGEENGRTAWQASGPGGMTFYEVQERLVEALIMLRRLPDREAGWHRARAADGPWDQVVAEWGDYADADAQPRLAGLTTAEVDEMEEALGWMRHVPARDRKLVGLAIVQLARGAREVSWSRLLAPMGLDLGTHGLRKRFDRALNAICLAENGGKA